MATEKKAKKSEKPQKAEQKEGSKYMPAIIIIAVIAIAIVLGYLASSQFAVGGSKQQGFSAFQSSFFSAPRVAVYVGFINGSTFSYADGCASALIESMVASKTHHRNMSTIDLMIIANSTSCLSPNGPLGKSNGTTVTPIASCLAVSNHEPSVFINYSDLNLTSVKAGNLYTQGDALFLSECGIAPELG